jgi:sterol desaturase/sphingolipid hydroxylase (fatty acid hydroxylase superfamily)
MIPLGGHRLALPVLLFVALGQAVVVTLWRGGYPWREALGTLGVVAGQFAIRPFARLLMIGTWMLVWPHRIATMPLGQPMTWLALFVAVEFFYYWQHRLSHRVRWLWATHAVHHSANHMNSLTALRLGWTEEISGGFLLFTPLVLVGFAPAAVGGMIILNLVYQFWVHSASTLRLGWLDYVLNTPSHHRVHHGCNPRYIDRNFGGVLIVFDRLFRTFTPELAEDPPRYGLVRRLVSGNPLVIALHEWRNLLRDVRHATGWRARLGVILGPP